MSVVEKQSDGNYSLKFKPACHYIKFRVSSHPLSMPEQRAAAAPAQGDAEPEQSTLQRVFKIGQVSFIGGPAPQPPNAINSKSYWSGQYHNLVCDCIFHCYHI